MTIAVPREVRVAGKPACWMMDPRHQRLQRCVAGIGSPDEGEIYLDGALLLLASPAGAYLNGVVLPVDGGHAVSAV